MLYQTCSAKIGGLIIGALLLALAGCGPDSRPETGTGTAGTVSAGNKTVSEVRELDWEDLIPEGYRPEKFLEEFSELFEEVLHLEDHDPLVEALMLKFKTFLDAAPVVPELDGVLARLPGFVVPLEGDGEMIFEFLLVPYYGACIHEPPPPANQIVHVIIEKGKGLVLKGLMEAVHVTGTLRVQHSSSELAAAGYTLHPTEIVHYR
jgi:uncharacterized protein